MHKDRLIELGSVRRTLECGDPKEEWPRLKVGVCISGLESGIQGVLREANICWLTDSSEDSLIVGLLSQLARWDGVVAETVLLVIDADLRESVIDGTELTGLS